MLSAWYVESDGRRCTLVVVMISITLQYNDECFKEKTSITLQELKRNRKDEFSVDV